jgi:arginine/lysine/ornithine decarboxylase
MMSLTHSFPDYFDDAPLFKALRGYIDADMTRFHMPGHKAGRSSPLYELFGDALDYDLTELAETDSLYDCESAIYNAERQTAQLYGVNDAIFSAGGSSLSIQTMLRLLSRRSKKVIAARNIHRAAVNAMALLSLEPIWVWPTSFEGSSLPGEIRPQDIEAALKSNPDAVGVYLTSPDYYGVMSDISGIAAVCHRYNKPLLVDNAHGAHLISIDGGKYHPIKQGADMTCDSPHKTLPVLTGGGWLLTNNDKFSRGDAKEAMSLFGSTSPSYLIMLSLDIARAWMMKHGNSAFESLMARVEGIDAYCRSIGFVKPSNALLDPVRITLDTASIGITGGDASLMLRDCGIAAEMNDDRHIVLLPSPFNSEEDFDRLWRFLKHLKSRKSLPLNKREAERPTIKMGLNDAINAPNELLSAEDAAGRVAAEAKCPCPPGVPLVMPGELISNQLAKELKSYGVLSIKVVK